jgi:U6 snRNA-associated Sm-like protein LSm2
MLFYTFFKSKIGEKIEITLRSEAVVTGTLRSIDQFLNFKLKNVVSTLSGLKTMDVCTVRGSSVKFARLNYEKNDLNQIFDATRYRFM